MKRKHTFFRKQRQGEKINLQLERVTVYKSEAVAQRCSVKKVFLETSENSQENISARVSFLIKLHGWALYFIKKKTLAQVFPYEFCEISKNSFPYRTPPMAASDKCEL